MSDPSSPAPPSAPPAKDSETDTREVVHHVVSGLRQVYQTASHLADMSPVDDIIANESEIIARSVQLTIESQLDRWSRQLRGAVYQASSRLRHNRNDQIEGQPTAFGCPVTGRVPGWNRKLVDDLD